MNKHWLRIQIFCVKRQVQIVRGVSLFLFQTLNTGTIPPTIKSVFIAMSASSGLSCWLLLVALILRVSFRQRT